MNLGQKNITFLLVKAGINQKEVANMAGIHEATLTYIKTGKKDLKIGTARKLAPILSKLCEIEYSLFEDGLALIEKDISVTLKEQAQALPQTSYKVHTSPTEYNIDEDLKLDPELSHIEKWLVSSARKISSGSTQSQISRTAAENLVQLMNMISPDSQKFMALLSFLRYEVLNDRSGKS